MQARVAQVYASDADATGHLSLTHWYATSGTVIGSSIDWRHCGHGDTTESWWRWLAGRLGDCGNVSIYSWQAREVIAALDLWGEIEARRWTLDGADPYYREDCGSPSDRRLNGYVVLEGPPTVVLCRSRTCATVCTWLDPQNYGLDSLERYVADSGVAMSVGCGLDGELWHGSVPLQLITSSVGRWVADYYHLVVGLDLAGPQHTAASQAHHGWRYHYMDARITVHDCKPILELERAALYCGRCECRYIGTLHSGGKPGELYGDTDTDGCNRTDVGPIYHLDVNSLYPAVARDARLPVKLRGVYRDMSPTDLSILCDRHCVAADVTVSTETPVVPTRLHGRIVWPVGIFRTTLCGPEIQLLLQHGSVISARTVAVYESANLYERWVSRLYEARLAYARYGKHGLASICKSILNASFGKWSQQSKRWVDVDDRIPPAPYYQWFESLPDAPVPVSYRSLAWQVQRLTIQGETNESFPAITATINSLGRAKLWSLLQTAGLGNTYYYDTDSIFCSGAGLEALRDAGEIDQTAMGKLKVVGTYDRVRFHGRQAYEADGRLVLSGYAGSHYVSGEATAETLRVPPIQHYLLRSQPPGLDRRVAKVRIARGYSHGHVQPDGSVLPIRFTPGE